MAASRSAAGATRGRLDVRDAIGPRGGDHLHRRGGGDRPRHGVVARWARAAGFVAGAATGASRLALSVHWLSDVVVGVLFGGGVAIASAVLVDVIAQAMPERRRFRRTRG